MSVPEHESLCSIAHMECKPSCLPKVSTNEKDVSFLDEEEDEEKKLKSKKVVEAT